MKTDLSQFYYLLTEDTERNRQAANMFAEVLDIPCARGMDLKQFKTMPILKTTPTGGFVCNYTRDTFDKTQITWEDLCAVHEEWKDGTQKVPSIDELKTLYVLWDHDNIENNIEAITILSELIGCKKELRGFEERLKRGLIYIRYSIEHDYVYNYSDFRLGEETTLEQLRIWFSMSGKPAYSKEDPTKELLDEAVECLQESAKIMSGGNGFASMGFLERINSVVDRLKKHGR